MSAGPLNLNDTMLSALLSGTLPPISSSEITAVLVAPSYVPDLVAHSRFSDVSDHEIQQATVSRLALTGVSVVGAAFHSDDLIFGDPVTLGPAKYLAFLFGRPNSLTAGSQLIGVSGLSPAGGAVEAQNARFSIECPEEGWFRLARA